MIQNINLTNKENFRLLFLLRNYFVAIGLLIVLFCEIFSDFKLLINFHLILFAFSILVNLSAVELLKNKDIKNIYFFIFLFFDIAIFTAHIFIAGGINNPFISLYILPIILSVIMLPNFMGISLIIYAIFFYSCLYFFYIPFQFTTNTPPLIFYKFHLFGMLVSFILVALTASFFIYLLVRNLRQKEYLVAQDYHLKYLGLLAANTAHQLRTPLNSIELIGAELAEKITPKKNFTRLKEQVKRANDIINDVVKYSNKADSNKKHLLNEVLLDICAKWENYFPSCKITISSKIKSNYHIIYSDDIAYALYNLFDNSLNAGANHIKVVIINEKQKATIQISDNGEGFCNNYKSGYGLYLSKLTLAKIGAKLKISKLKPAIITIDLPIKI